MSTLIHQAERPHHCNMGWQLQPMPEDALARSTGAQSYWVPVHRHDPAGTIRQCTACGRTWVACDPPKNDTGRGMQSVGTEWRPENEYDRRRREGLPTGLSRIWARLKRAVTS